MEVADPGVEQEITIGCQAITIGLVVKDFAVALSKKRRSSVRGAGLRVTIFVDGVLI